jgi:hypothetical protein
MLQEWPGLLDVLAVLDGASQLRVGNGVSWCSNLQLGKRRREKTDEAHRLCEVPGVR